MRLPRIFIGIVLLAGASLSCRAVTPGAAAPAAPAHAPEMPPLTTDRTVTYQDALVLGLVEGVTEYLPVSSTGHLILASHVLGLDDERALVAPDGRPLLVMHHGVNQEVTLKSAVDSYNIIIQGGAILAVLILYWKRVLSLLRGIAGRDPAGLRLLINLVISFIPAAALGLATDKWIEAHLFSHITVAYGLGLGAFIMLGAEYWRRNRAMSTAALPPREIHQLTFGQALLIGLCQCLSLWPGMSRSMTTIVGGYLAGLRPAQAAEYSFLLGLMTLSAASGYKAVTHGAELAAGLHVGPLLFGIAVAAVSAAVSVKWLVHWLTKHGLGVFAGYRLLLAVVILATL